jgi:hypothetical protein
MTAGMNIKQHENLSLDCWNKEYVLIYQLFSPPIDTMFDYAVGSMEAIWARSDGGCSVVGLPCARSRLLRVNRTIPDTTSAIQPNVQIHDAV